MHKGDAGEREYRQADALAGENCGAADKERSERRAVDMREPEAGDQVVVNEVRERDDQQGRSERQCAPEERRETQADAEQENCGAKDAPIASPAIGAEAMCRTSCSR